MAVYVAYALDHGAVTFDPVVVPLSRAATASRARCIKAMPSYDRALRALCGPSSQ
jgi:hypothetical protein